MNTLKMNITEKARLRTDILHDLKKVAICINQLVRDLDRVERQEPNKEGANG